MSESLFPRGGTDRGVHKLVTQESDEIFKDDSIQISSTASKSVQDRKNKPSRPAVYKKKEKIQKKTKATKSLLGSSTGDTDVIAPERLTNKNTTVGSLVLAAVKECKDYEVHLNLPNNLTAVVAISHLPSGYTNLLKAYALSHSEHMLDSQELCPLSDIYPVGSCLPCVVTGETSVGRPWYQCSINPPDVHKRLDISALNKQMVIYGAVHSVEEHGFTIDIGIRNVKVFMRAPREIGLKVGMIRRFRVTDSFNRLALEQGESRTINVDLFDCSEDKETAVSMNGIEFNTLIPGSLIKGIIASRRNEGLTMFLSGVRGYIHLTHLSKHHKDYKPSSEIKCRVLAVNPTTKYVHLTQLSNIMKKMDSDTMCSDNPGFGATITFTINRLVNKLAFITLPSGKESYVSSSLISGEIKISYKPKETEVTGYWLGYDYLEDRPLISTKPVNMAVSKLSVFKPGQHIKVKIDRISSTGVKVSMKNGIFGFIPIIHLTEVPLKHPEKKFKVEQMIECKVLSIQTDKGRVRLTCKPSLMKIENSVTQYSDLTPGAIVTGVIVKLTTGALISFFNNVKGFVRPALLAKEYIETPSKVFYIGQSVKCRVVSCDEDEKKCSLSFLLDQKSIENQLNRGSQTQQRFAEDGVPVGKVWTSLTVNEVSGAGVQLKSSDGEFVFMPKSHISECSILSSRLLENFQMGAEIKDLITTESDDRKTIVSNRSLFKTLISQGHTVRSVNDVEVGKVYPAIVLGINSSHRGGVYWTVGLNHGVKAYCHPMDFPQHINLMYMDTHCIGESVLVKVLEVDIIHGEVMVSLKESDCFHKNLQKLTSDILFSYLKDLHQFTQSHTKSDTVRYKIGDIVQTEVTEVLNERISVILDDGTPAVCKRVTQKDTKSAKEEKKINRAKSKNKNKNREEPADVNYKPGDKVSAMVTYVDYETNNLDVVLNKHVVNDRVKHGQEDKFSQSKVGSYLKAEVIYERHQYILLMLKGHALGKLAFMTQKKHPNSRMSGVVLGEIVKVLVENRIDEMNAPIMVRLYTNVDQALEIIKKNNLPAIGSTHKAEVVSIEGTLMHVKIGECYGSVRIWELEDKPNVNTTPMEKFKPEDQLKVHVTSAAIVKDAYKFKKLLKNMKYNIILECSLRRKHVPTDPQPPDYGSLISVYITEMKIGSHLSLKTTEGLSARIEWFDLNMTSHEVNEVRSLYQVGQCIQLRVDERRKDDIITMKLPTYNKGPEKSIIDNKPMAAAIVKVKPSVGLVVKCKLSNNCVIPLTEMAEIGKDVTFSKFTEGAFVQVHLIGKTRHGKYTMTLNEKSSLKSAEELEPTSSYGGIFSKITPKDTQVMVAGNIIKIDNMTPSEYSQVSKMYKFGMACEVRIIAKTEHGAIHGDIVLPELKMKDDSDVGSMSVHENQSAHKVTRQHPSVTNLVPKLNTSAKKASIKVVKESLVKPPKRKLTSGHTKDMDVENENPKRRVEKLLTETDNVTGVELKFNKTAVNPLIDFTATLKTTKTSSALDKQLKKLEQQGKKVDHSKQMEIDVENQSTSAVTSDLADKEITADGLLAKLKQNPNSGFNWSKLVTLTVENKGIEAARARSEQAFEAISYRLESEKLLVWAALLRAELHFGSEETLDHAVRRAVQLQDEVKVYTELAKIYADAGKINDAEQCYQNMLRKRKENVGLWASICTFFYEHDRCESARTHMQKALKSLPNKTHVDLISKCAQLEFKHGDSDRGTSLFESVISNFPKRTDIWSMYIDVLIKSNKMQDCRGVLKRVCMQKMNSKKIQNFLRRYLDFENQYGTEEEISEVRDLAKSVGVDEI